MTDTTQYSNPWPQAPRQQDAPGAPGPVLLSVAGPAPQRRATVAVRLILAVPHLLALYVLGIAAVFVVVIGWLGALASGRLPRFAATYLSGYLRWYARVGAYLLLLTDEYPPFALGDAAYPVRLAVGPGKLNRLTVLFRIILAIPVAIVWMLLSSGLAVTVILIGWLTALIAGRLPASVHQASAAALRYGSRCSGYLYLLTDAYPAGLFGDEPSYPAPGTASYSEDSGWRLALSPGAKRLVGLMLLVGLLAAAGGGAWAGAAISAARQRDREISQLRVEVARFNAVVARHNAAFAALRQATGQANNAVNALSSAHDALDSALNSPGADATNCQTVSCFNATSQPGAKAFAAFGRTLHGTHVPPGSTAVALRLATDTAGTEQDWVKMTQATSFGSFEVDATAAENVGGRFDNDYQALITSINNGLAALGNQAVALSAQGSTLNQQGAALRRQATHLNVLISVPTAD